MGSGPIKRKRKTALYDEWILIVHVKILVKTSIFVYQCMYVITLCD